MAFKIMDKIGIVLGNRKVDNTYFVNQVGEGQRASLAHYYEDILGREIRYLADKSQTSLSLACDAAKKALQDNHISGKDMDMVICITHSPEYSSPVTARFVIDAIGGRHDIEYFDMNQNCTGMLVALDIADKYFKTDEHINHILIVQGDINSTLKTEPTSPFFGIMSDGGCAIILERSQESGIRERYFMLTEGAMNNIVYPLEGYSVCGYQKKEPMVYVNPHHNPEVELAVNGMVKQLGKEKLEQVKLFCVSQFMPTNRSMLADIAKVSPDKIPYVGDKYGYTGASSPFLALRDSLDQGMIKRGDSIVFWTYGAGVQHVMLEMIY